MTTAPISLKDKTAFQTSGGRPSKWSREASAAVLVGLRRGWPVSLCCEAAGICNATLWLWRKKYPKFDSQCRKALIRGISSRLKRIETASVSGDWRASAWLLEHSQAEHFARTRVEVTGADGGPLEGRTMVLIWPHNVKQHDHGKIAADNIASTAPHAD